MNVVLQGREYCQNAWDGLVRMDTGDMRADLEAVGVGRGSGEASAGAMATSTGWSALIF